MSAELSSSAKSKVNGMNKDQLIKFIEDSTNAAYRQALGKAEDRTGNYQDAKALNAAISARAQQAIGFKGKSQAWADAENRFTTRKQTSAQELTDFNTQYQTCTKDLAASIDASTAADQKAQQASRSKCIAKAKEITPEMHKVMNIMFEEESPKVLTAGLESFVALLRDRERADRVDVKLYLSNAGNLQYKLKNIDPKELSMKYVTQHMADLKGHVNSMRNDQAAGQYVVFAEWGVCFAEYAADILDQFECAERVVTLTKQKAWLQTMIKIQQKATEIYQDKEVADKLAGGINDANYVKQMEDAADEAMRKTTGPAQAAQTALKDFGTHHFQGLIRGGAAAADNSQAAPAKKRQSRFADSTN